VIPGLILAYSFFYLYEKHQAWNKPFWYTSILHAVVNGFALIVHVMN
jgi:hypothetical protein